MNELFVLGELMEGPKTGYQLRFNLEGTLGGHRKVSFGTLYPLLDKLAAQDLITLTIDENDGRNKKIATLTPAGKARFEQLMREPVAQNAHTMDVYLIKVNAMWALPLADQLLILAEFRAEQQEILAGVQEDLAHFDQHQGGLDHLYAKGLAELRQRTTEVVLSWIDEVEGAITGDDDEN